jgi:hypothetical protein
MRELLTIEEVAERLRVKVLTIRWLRQEAGFLLRSRWGAGSSGTPPTSRPGWRPSASRRRSDERPADRSRRDVALPRAGEVPRP